MKCLECNKEFINKLKLSAHVRFFHKISMKEYWDKFNINKCKTCNCDLWYYNKTGYCTKCLRDIGYFKEQWKNEEYRNKVIKGVSKPRRKGFKEEQSIRIKQWYKDNPEQRIIRSKKMKESWRTGKILSNNCSYNRSKQEDKVYQKILSFLSEALPNHVIKYKNRKWFIVDIFIPCNNMVVEYFGDYWHANPKHYKENDIIHHGILAKEIWEADKDKISKLEELGYRVRIILQSEFEENEEEIIDELKVLDWDSCAL